MMMIHRLEYAIIIIPQSTTTTSTTTTSNDVVSTTAFTPIRISRYHSILPTIHMWKGTGIFFNPASTRGIGEEGDGSVCVVCCCCCCIGSIDDESKLLQMQKSIVQMSRVVVVCDPCKDMFLGRSRRCTPSTTAATANTRKVEYATGMRITI